MKTNHKPLRTVLFTVTMLVLLASGLAQADDIYVSCWGNSGYDGTIEKIDSNGNRSTFASGLDYPTGLAFDSSGNLYVANCNGGTIKKFDPSGNGTVFASGLSSPWSLVFDSGGNLCVANCGGGTIEKFDSNGNRSTFASCPTPLGLAFDSSGYLYVSNVNMGSETIEKYDSNGNGSTFVSGGIPDGLAFDSSGYLYVADYSGIIKKYDSNGNWTIFASGLNIPMGIVFDSSGNLYVVDNISGTIEKFDPSGNRSTFASGLIYPQLIVIQAPGRVSVTMRVIPRTINLKRHRQWIMSTVWMGDTLRAEDVDVSSLRLLDTVTPSTVTIDLVKNQLRIIFDLVDVQSLLTAGDTVEITLTGQMQDGTLIAATDTVRVINPGKCK